VTTERVLVAGIGNVFLGDDGFGVEVVHRLREVALPERVDLADYGIRGVHLAYDLLDSRFPTVILVDALPLPDAPGTLAVIQVDRDDPRWVLGPQELLEAPAADGHGMDPESVLRLVQGLGGRIPRVLVVGCRPAVLDEGMRLSPPVRAALDEAVRTVARLAWVEAGLLDTGGPATRRGEVATGA
jgi:hydrogenase maturation protease